MAYTDTILGKEYCYAQHGEGDWLPNHERVAQNHFMSRIKEGDIVFDIGAQYGNWTIPAATRSPARVYAFEPWPKFISVLKYNIAVNSDNIRNRIKVIETGLVDKKLESCEYSERFQSVVYAMDEERENEANRVPVRTLDDYMEENKDDIKYVDHIKIDVDGAELLAVQGAKETIITYCPTIAIEEHNAIYSNVSAEIYKVLVMEWQLPYNYYSWQIPNDNAQVPNTEIGGDVFVGPIGSYSQCRHGLYYFPGRTRLS